MSGNKSIILCDTFQSYLAVVGERENKKSKVKLAFRETEPFQSADYVE